MLRIKIVDEITNEWFRHNQLSLNELWKGAELTVIKMIKINTSVQQMLSLAPKEEKQWWGSWVLQLWQYDSMEI